MYQSRKPMYAYKRFISNGPASSNEIVRLFSGLRMLEKTLKRNHSYKVELTRADVQAGLDYCREQCAECFEEIRQDIADAKLDADIAEKFREALIKDELPLGFYFLVYAPCLSFYQTSPAQLYSRALERDISAIEMLLKLDPLLLHDPVLGYQIQSVRLYGKSKDYDQILEAITKQPKINYKQLADERRGIKSDHGAQILAFARLSGHHLEAAQIRELYDAFAQDIDGMLIDTDIKKPGGFDKSVRSKAAILQKQYQQSEKQK